MDAQLLKHKGTITQMIELQGNNESYTREYLGKCMYTVGIGSNDYMNNYLIPDLFPTSRVYGPDEWAAELVRRYYGCLKVYIHTLFSNNLVYHYVS